MSRSPLTDWRVLLTLSFISLCSIVLEGNVIALVFFVVEYWAAIIIFDEECKETTLLNHQDVV